MPLRKTRSGGPKRKKKPAPAAPAVEEVESPVVSDGDNAVSDVDSVVVSDDDGVDAAARTGDFPSMSDVEHLSDDSSSSESDSPPDGAEGAAADDSGSDSGAESDSTIEGEANPVGDIPMEWYHGYDHIGYSRDGEKIVASNKPSALDLAADPHAWRRIYDEKNDEQLSLTHAELKAIARMQTGRYPGSQLDDAGELVAWAGPVRDAPLPAGTEPKRRFLPSHHEARLVVRFVRAMREGRMQRPSERRRRLREGGDDAGLFDIWQDHEPKTLEDMSKSERARGVMHVAAPKVALPRHDESYNPPAEYLPTPAERKAWEASAEEDRATNYLPEKQEALRHVGAYPDFIKERFERCLDLYLAVRIRQPTEKLTADDLVPQLPSPRQLRPFPTAVVLDFAPLPARARSIDVHPAGQWLLSGSDDGVVRLWETSTGFMRAQWAFSDRVPKIDGRVQPIMSVAWRPVADSFVFAVCIGKSLYFVAAGSALGLDDIDGEELLQAGEAAGKADEAKEKENGAASGDDKDADEENKAGDKDDEGDATDAPAPRAVSWKGLSEISHGSGKSALLEVSHRRQLRMATWHTKGDYVAVVGKDSSGGTVALHRLTQRTSRVLFRRRSSGVQCVRFHPTRPLFFVATMHHVRVYNLSAESSVKVLKPGMRWISSIDIHRSGDHVLVTSYDKRVCWFDLDLSDRPYKTLRHHENAVRAAKFHPRLPLFADAADDGNVQVFHGMAYDDLAKNALIVPVKKLAGAHEITDSLGVLDIAWHPRLPWLFSAGADKRIRVFGDTS